MKLCVLIFIVTDGGILARRSIKRNPMKAKIRDYFIALLGIMITPITLLIVLISEIIKRIKKWRKKEQ